VRVQVGFQHAPGCVCGVPTARACNVHVQFLCFFVDVVMTTGEIAPQSRVNLRRLTAAPPRALAAVRENAAGSKLALERRSQARVEARLGLL
jgi:hypothetical protein